jgi:hypothetical protein
MWSRNWQLSDKTVNLHYDGNQIKAMRWVKYVTYMWEMKNSHIQIFRGENQKKKKSDQLEDLWMKKLKCILNTGREGTD